MIPGEIKTIGKHRLMCGDSTDPDDINKLLEGRKFDICVTDPPYLASKLKMDKDGIDLDKFALCIKENMKQNAWVFMYGTPNVYKTVSDTLRRKFEYIWIKPIGTPVLKSTKFPMLNHEICWAFIHPELKRMGKLYMDKKALRTPGKSYTFERKKWSSEYGDAYHHKPVTTINDGYREGVSVLYYASKNVIMRKEGYYHKEFGMKTIHPTQKPQAMYELVLNGYCMPGGMVYEPCGGSGTGMVSAEVTGRTCYMMEKDPKYCDIITNRMKKVQTKMESF